MEAELKDKVVIITGALGALGRCLSMRFAEEGAHVMACFRGEPERFDALRASVEQAGAAGAVSPHVLDVTDQGQVAAVVEEVASSHQRIDVLVNNAGQNDQAPFMMQEGDVWQGIVDTNLTGARHMCAAVSKPMMLRRSGAIINISSVLGTVLGRGAAAYAASKAALNRFTEVAALELGKFNIRVNGVSPGLLSAGLGLGAEPHAEAFAADRTPLGRRGTLDEVADAVVFLASSRASYITGHILSVDGGLSIG
jgi:NAD(P)-dependent dehydrogenase (short-subunit alcohol dehydrogenase family)